MNNQKKKLGAGLASLLGEIDFADNKNSSVSSFIDISLILPNPHQPRKYFDEESILELSRSIADNGVLQPILVYKKDSQYIIVAGERRLRAAKIANLEQIPCIIVSKEESNVDAIAIIENIQRKDLTVFEEALSYSKLIEKFNYTHEELSNILSKSRSTITNMLRLLKLPQLVLDLISQDLISFSHAKLLMSIEDQEECSRLAQYAVDNNLTIKQLEKVIKHNNDEVVDAVRHDLGSLSSMLRNNNIIPDDSYNESNLSSINRQINKKCKSCNLPKMNIKSKTETSGKLIISYNSLQQLEKIFSKIMYDKG